MPPRARHTSPAVKIAAVLAITIVVLLCAVISNNARRKTQQNTSARLDLVRRRYETCDLEVRMLNGETLSEAHEVQLAQEEYDAVKQENDLLKEDNAELRQDMAELEREVDDLRESLDDRDFISEDEAEELEETLALGNNSKALVDLLEGAKFGQGQDIVVGKDHLVGLLLAELKVKRSALGACMAEKKVVGRFEGQMLWEEMNDEQRAAILRAQVKKIALLQRTDPRAAEALLEQWGARHYRGVAGLRDDVARRAAAPRPIHRKGALAKAEEEPGGDDQWKEWDWDGP